MKKLARFAVWFIVAAIIVVSLANLVLLVKIVHDQESSIQQHSEKILELEYKNRQLLETVEEVRNRPEPTVYHGKDGENGVKGDKGDNGKDGANGTNGVDGKNGVDGRTFEIACDQSKNRWQVRYSGTDNWKVLSGLPIKCTVTKEDILQALGEVQDGN